MTQRHRKQNSRPMTCRDISQLCNSSHLSTCLCMQPRQWSMLSLLFRWSTVSNSSLLLLPSSKANRLHNLNIWEAKMSLKEYSSSNSLYNLSCLLNSNMKSNSEVRRKRLQRRSSLTLSRKTHLMLMNQNKEQQLPSTKD